MDPVETWRQFCESLLELNDLTIDVDKPYNTLTSVQLEDIAEVARRLAERAEDLSEWALRGGFLSTLSSEKE